MFIQLEKRATWHRVLDVWDTRTFCGQDAGRRVSAMKEKPHPAEFVCPECRNEADKRDRADNEQAASTAG